MIRCFLAAALFAPALFAQSPEQRLQGAWANYLKFDILGGPGDTPQAGLGEAMDDLGKAWAAWAEWRGPNATPLPDPMNFQRSDEPDTLAPPQSRVLAHQGSWSLMGLEVPVPCGSHLFLALFKETAGRWKLVMLDLHEPRSEADPLGAREHVQALLLEGPKVVVASTPPWCTSCWSVLHARAEAPGVDTQHPSVLTRFSDRIYRCADEDMLRMRPVKGGVRLRYQGMAGQDGTTVPRTKTLRIH